MNLSELRLVVVALILMAVSGCKPGHNYSLLPFDKTRWETDVDARVGMITDLCRNHLHKGMPKEDIEKMLGTPDRILSPSDFSAEYAELAGFSEMWMYRLLIEYKRCYACFDTHEFRIHLDEKGNYMGHSFFCN